MWIELKKPLNGHQGFEPNLVIYGENRQMSSVFKMQTDNMNVILPGRLDPQIFRLEILLYDFAIFVLGQDIDKAGDFRNLITAEALQRSFLISFNPSGLRRVNS